MQKLIIGGPCYYLSGSPEQPHVVKGMVTWLGVLAVRVADPVGVRILERRHVYATEQLARVAAWYVLASGAA